MFYRRNLPASVNSSPLRILRNGTKNKNAFIVRCQIKVHNWDLN